MSRTILSGLVLIFVLALGVANSVFTVTEVQQALVLQFGDYRRTLRDPGLYLKLPFIENIVYLDKRVLDLEPPMEQVILSDQRRLEVDAFIRYTIERPLDYYRTVGQTGAADNRLSSTASATLRRVLGSATQQQILSRDRDRLMEEVTRQVNLEAQRYGIRIVDVRIRRADVPDATTQAIFARMRSEREREASEFRAQGQEQAQQIRSRAERERTVILAEAQRDGQILKGEGDNTALRLLAEANGQDARFYGFYRSLQAYRDTMRNEDTTMILSPTGEFFRYFNGSKANEVP